MTRLSQNTFAVAGLILLGAAGACSRDAAPTSARGAVGTTLALHTVSAAPAGAAVADSPLPDDDDHGHGRFGRIGRADIDSLTVDVTKVEVLAARADTENAADSAAEAQADTGRHGDNDADDDHENDERTWLSLDVTAGGHLDLLRLPDSAQTGVTIATGTLPPGTITGDGKIILSPILRVHDGR